MAEKCQHLKNLEMKPSEMESRYLRRSSSQPYLEVTSNSPKNHLDLYLWTWRANLSEIFSSLRNCQAESIYRPCAPWSDCYAAAAQLVVWTSVVWSCSPYQIKSNQKVNLYSASSIKNSQTRHLHISTLKQPCLKSTLELFPGNVTAS